MHTTRLAVVVAAPALFVQTLSAEPQPGWTLYAGFNSTDTTLIDLDGEIVHTWPSTHEPGTWVYLLDDGDIIRAARDPGLPGPTGGGFGGRIHRIAWDGTLEWDYRIAALTRRQHHDLHPLPNGNVLAIVWVVKSDTEAIAMGRDPATVGLQVWSESIWEIRQTGPTTGEVVWQWNVWDNLIQDFDPDLPNYGDPSENPGRIDINYAPNGTNADWLHFNAIDYNEDLDQIVISCHGTDELWVISHAPGDSGELLYRWGNPQAYGMGTPEDKQLFDQHNTRWIPEGFPGAGNILVYNNGAGRPEGNFSTVDEIVPPINPDGTYHREPGQPFGPDAPVWQCDNVGGESFYAPFISGAQRLENGNTLICVGNSGEFFEVRPDCSIAWEHAPGGFQFRATRIDIRDTRLRDLLWCAADLAEPYDTLDLADIVAFINAFMDQDELADLADPFGVWDLADVVAFEQAFSAGCP